MTANPLGVPGQLMFDDPVLRPNNEADVEPQSPAEPQPPAEPEPLEGVETPQLSGTPAADTAPKQASLSATVIRSKRRTKTAQARLVGSTVEVRIPSRCSPEEEQRLVEHFVNKFERSRSTDAIDLDERARQLAERFGLPEPTSIRWVTNQRSRWGSCTPSDGTIRLSDRLAGFPPWVIDYVIVHELSHLVVPGHDADFWALVEAYPLCERARGFLIAKGLDGE